uniref:Uncharacterized protein n=1 Tax=Anguilla anguilla TaxID=7936 RepID=A0A0E9RT78_ANGAN
MFLVPAAPEQSLLQMQLAKRMLGTQCPCFPGNTPVNVQSSMVLGLHKMGHTVNSILPK